MNESPAAQTRDSEKSRSGKTRYGWVMVAVAAAAMIATLPGRTHGLGMITERVLSDPAFELTRSRYGQFNLWATLIGSLFCLGIGNWIDRRGLRWTLTGVLVLLGGVVLAMTFARSAIYLFMALTLSRGLGQSALSVVSISIIGKWFPRNVSLPMGVYALGVAIGFIAIALVGREFADVDWRLLWRSIGGSILGLAVLLALIAREPPRVAAARCPSREQADSNSDFTLAEAIRTPLFWVSGISLALYGMIAAGFSLFNESIFVDRGFSNEVYYESLAMGTGVALLANLSTGFLGTRCSIGRLLAVALVLLAVSLAWLTQLVRYSDVVLFVCLNAVAGGMLTVLFFTVWRQAFGQTHLGRIQGVAQMMTVVGSALGPLLFAYFRDETGSYNPLLWGLALVAAMAAMAAWFVPGPVHPSTGSEIDSKADSA